MGHLLSLKMLFYYFNVNVFQRWWCWCWSVTGVRKDKRFTGFVNKTLDENDDVFFSLSVWETFAQHTLQINVWLLSACLQIVGDAVGWGFVVRGNRPCHIQAVEPQGPAALAGMKVSVTGRWLQEEATAVNSCTKYPDIVLKRYQLKLN